MPIPPTLLSILMVSDLFQVLQLDPMSASTSPLSHRRHIFQSWLTFCMLKLFRKKGGKGE